MTTQRQFFLKRDMHRRNQYEKHGKQKAWTDVYSLCAVCYEMITGAIAESSLSRKEKDTLYPPSMYGAEITLEQEKVLLKGMALDYRERYSSVRELREAFLGKDEQESPESRKKEGTGLQKICTTAVGHSNCGSCWNGNSEGRKNGTESAVCWKFLQRIQGSTGTSYADRQRQSLLKHRRMEQTVFFICQKKRSEHTDFPVTAFVFSEQERNWMLI